METVLSYGLIAKASEYHIIGISGNDRVVNVEVQQRINLTIVLVCEAQSSPAVRVKRIELSHGAVAQNHISAKESRAIIESIGYLRIIQVELTVCRHQSIALTVVYLRVIELHL